MILKVAYRAIIAGNVQKDDRSDSDVSEQSHEKKK